MIGEKIRTIRKERCITQEGLAMKLDINRATLSKYESGLIDPPLDVLQKIAKTLRVPISYIFGEGWGQTLSFDLQEKIFSTVEDRVDTVLSTVDPEDLFEVFGSHDYEVALKSFIDREMPLTLNQLEEVADQLGVPLEYLLGQVEEPDLPVRNEEEQQNFMEIIIALDKLNDDGQKKAIERINELTEIPRFKRGE